MNINYLANFVVKGHHPSVDTVNVVVSSLMAAHLEENNGLVVEDYIKELEELRDKAVMLSLEHWKNSAGIVTETGSRITDSLRYNLNSYIGVLKTLACNENKEV